MSLELIKISDAHDLTLTDKNIEFSNIFTEMMDVLTNIKIAPKTEKIDNMKIDFLIKIAKCMHGVATNKNIDIKKMELLIKQSINIETSINEILDLNMSLKEYLYETKKENSVYPATDFQNKLNEISEDSLIIYITKAQLYKVYKPENMDDFQNDDNTHYRKSEHGPAYEVVRDEHSQKLLIVIDGDIKNNKITRVEEYIKEFIDETSNTSGVSIADLKVYNNNNTTEFIVSNIKLKNLHARESYIEDFIMFMRKKGENDIATKIQVRPPPCELKGARFYDLPSVKKLISSTTKPTNDHIANHMVTNLQQPVVIQQNTFIFNTVNNTINGDVKIKTASGKGNKQSIKTLKTFYKFIYDTKPEWYIENKTISMRTIEDAYRSYFADTVISSSVISRKLKGHLFSDAGRSNGETRKKLVPYETLKKHC